MPDEMVRLKGLFFTAKAVTDRVDPATRKALSRAGAFTRRTAKNSVKYKDGPAPPGRPPHAHRTAGFTKTTTAKGKKKQQPASPFRELIYFAYDPAHKSVVIGPAIGGSRSGAPETLEEGGAATVDGKTVYIRPRPTMKPALDKEMGKAAEGFRDAIK